MTGDAAAEIEADGPVLCFGGPYSNLHATRALLDEARRLGIPPRRTLCTGDAAAYCADPAATLDLLIGAGIPVVAGNCEESLAAGSGDCGCGFEHGSACDVLSRGWFAHAARTVTAAHRAWMAALPRRLVLRVGRRRLAVLHGGADETNRFLFPSAPDAALAEEVARTGCDGVIAGHCGLPFSRVVDGAPAGAASRGATRGVPASAPRRVLWHNPGAIGMPADDGTPRTWFSILVPQGERLRVEHRALSHDWRAAQAAMRAAGLDGGYADALGAGLWPSDGVLPPAERMRRGVPLAPTPVLW